MEQPAGGEDDHDPIKQRISIKGARRMLGMVARNYSDEEITELLDILYGISKDAFEMHRNDGRD
ncbi:hypothetical protein [Cohaesibacter gelatinilyticus]|uniref:Uncharacterized protein n=1 Tax=Cohaesibacter gelatinilyticus TaxID=372072 RepID=A0A285PEE9_9HYPH|nr:hypothetical protein [Cohaesibacter gelatinilyticus]SNZ20099.1 hypothetical protein SAMN06265368_3198 [Cohaesibacter gelatinilyticus]